MECDFLRITVHREAIPHLMVILIFDSTTQIASHFPFLSKLLHISGHQIPKNKKERMCGRIDSPFLHIVIQIKTKNKGNGWKYLE